MTGPDSTLSMDDAAFIAEKLCEAAPTYHDKIKVVKALLATDFTRIFIALEDDRKANAPKLEGPPPAPPSLSEIRAVQATIWDNWKDAAPDERRGNRFGLTLELYWDKPERIKLSKPNFRSQIGLMPGKQLATHVRKNIVGKERVYPVAEDYLDVLQRYCKSLSTEEYFGPVNTTIRHNTSDYERGVAYHDHQFVTVKGAIWGGVITEAKLHMMGETLDINHFVGKPYGKKPFADKIVMQARIDRCGFFPDWASNSSLGDDD